MPPWAQTEWERLTGTMENRSTCPPTSAILMVAESPARPPPMTMIFGFDAMSLKFQSAGIQRLLTYEKRLCGTGHGLQRRLQERIHRGRACGDEDHRDGKANVTPLAACVVTAGNPPLSREQPQTISKVPGSRYDGDRIKSNDPGILEFHLYLGKSNGRLSENMRSVETQMPDVISHVEERDRTGPALGCIHPIAHPGIVADVGFSAIPDVKAVQSVKRDGNPDKEQLQKEDERKSGKQGDLLGIGRRALRGDEIGKKVLYQKRANGDDAGQGMQPAQKE